MATVALLGIPLNSDSDYGFGEPKQFFTPAGTDKPRKDLESLLLKANSQLHIVDLGELLTPTLSWHITEQDYNALGLKVRELLASGKEADVVLAIGGDHSAAFPFYNLPGHVVRADAHGDVYPNPPFSPSQLNGATYMSHVSKQGLKRPEDVWNVGVQRVTTQEYRDRDIFGGHLTVAGVLRMPTVPEIGFFDIDTDVLSEKYGLPHGYSTSNLTVKDLTALVIRLKPRIVGLFECVRVDRSYSRFIPGNIFSDYANVFGPICKAVAELAVARSLTNQQNPQASSVTYH